MGSGLIFITLTTLSLSAVSREDMGSASGLFNMVRTIGGSIGIAVLVAMLSSEAQIHQSYLSARIDPSTLGTFQHAYPAAGAMGNITRHGLCQWRGLAHRSAQRQHSPRRFPDDCS